MPALFHWYALSYASLKPLLHDAPSVWGPLAMHMILSAGMIVFDPRGRSHRSQMLIAAGVLLGVETLLFFTQDRLGGSSSPVVMTIKALMALVGLTAIIRRLHDLGLSGWWALGGLAGLCMWTAVIAVAGMLFMGRDVLAPGSLSAMVVASLVMLPAFGATLWLHLAEGEPFRNRFGHPCMPALTGRDLAESEATLSIR